MAWLSKVVRTFGFARRDEAELVKSLNLEGLGTVLKTSKADTAFRDLSTEERQKVAENNAVVYACVMAKARAFAQAPTVLQRWNAASETWDEADWDDPFDANPDLSASEIKQLLVQHVELTGRSFAWLWRDGAGVVREVWPVPPSWVKVNVRKELPREGKESRLIESYTITPGGSASRGTSGWTVPVGDVMYSRYPHPSRLWDGLSPLAAASRAVQLDDMGDEYRGEAMQSLRLPGVVVKTAKPLNKRQKEDLRAVLRQKTGGDARENAIIISGDDAAVSLLNPMEGFNWREYAHLNETRICMVFGVPPIVVGALVGLENSPWSNVGEAKRWFYQNTVSGLWTMYASAMTSALVPEDARGEFRVSFDTSEVKELREEADAVVDRASRLYEAGLVTRNEARELAGYDATDDGDVYRYPATAVLYGAGEGVNPSAGVALTPEEQAAGVRATREGKA